MEFCCKFSLIILSITCACRSRSGSGLSRPGGLEDPLPNPLEWLGLSRPGGLEEPLPKSRAWLGDSISIKKKNTIKMFEIIESSPS